MKAGIFAILNNAKVVSIKNKMKDTETGEEGYLVEWVLDKVKEAKSKSKPKPFFVYSTELTPFTQETANTLLYLHDKEISQHNIEKHIINDCLQYI